MKTLQRFFFARFRFSIWAFFVLLIAGMGSSCSSRGSRDPDVVLIVFDALHAGHVSHLGYTRDTTPNLNELAREGVSFTHACSPAPFTIASIASLLTGRLPDSHGLTQKDRKLPAAEITLAEALHAKGYRTFGATASGNGSASYGFDQGFDEFVELFQGKGGPDCINVEQDGNWMHAPRADEFLPLLDERLGRAAEGAPRFFYLHVLEPHIPYTPPEPFRSKYIDPAYAGPFRSGDGQLLVDTVRGRAKAGADDRQASLDLYDANVAWADHVLGLILERLKKAGLYEDAMIIVTSDHGEAFWQHGMWGHNYQLYGEMLRVPLVVKPPGRSGPRNLRVDDLVSPMDIVPTLAERLHLDVPAERLDGQSFAPLLEGRAENGKDRVLLLRSHHTAPLLALQTRKSKLILDTKVTLDGDKRTVTQEVERYDLSKDEEEKNDLGAPLAPEDWRRVDYLKGLLLSLRKKGNEGHSTLTGAQKKLLESLGY